MDPSAPHPPHDPCPELDAEAQAWSRHLEDDERSLASVALGADLVERVVQRLASTWNDLNYRHLRGLMRPPSLALHDGERRWGAWHPGRRLITISRRQALCYTWASVTETLKHEMAHQFVSEHLRADGREPPHGRSFRDACLRLGCDPSATGDGGVSLFRPGGPGAEATPEDARLLRIQKLLSLADNNPDEHEARAAFARAAELMRKYNLDPDERPAGLSGADDYVWREVGPVASRIAHHRYVIAGIIQEFFFVQGIWVDTFDVRTGERGHVLELMGTRGNVDMAHYIHDCLLRQGEALWQQFKREQGVRDRGARRQYLDGLYAGFRRQLQQGERQSAERGLVRVDDEGLTRFARRRHPRTTTTRLESVARSDVRQAGVAAGEQLRLHKPVTGGDGPGRGLLLPG